MMTTIPLDIENELEHLYASFSPLNSICYDIFEAMLPTKISPPHPNINQAFVSESVIEHPSYSMKSNETIPPSTSLKNPRSDTPPNPNSLQKLSIMTLSHRRKSMRQDNVF